jgi:hypothetical protein
MILKEILDLARERLDDKGQPRLWGDNELVAYLNASQNEAAERGKLFLDSVTVAVCQIAIVGANALSDFLLDTRILTVEAASLSTQTRPLWRTDRASINLVNPDWRNATAGESRNFLTDYAEGYITLNPKPAVNCTLNMTVVRLPLVQLSLTGTIASPTTTGLNASPEIAFQHHIRLLNGMCALAYNKDDAETLDPQKAARYKADWEKDIDAMTKTRIRKNESKGFMGYIGLSKGAI